jgi:hypothetical protein
MSQAVSAPLATRVLAWGSWLSLGGAVLTALTALFCQWGVNAESLGARDMGLALHLASVAAIALVGSLYAAPVLAALGFLSLFLQRRIGFRFLAAGAVTALPLAVLTWLERG